MFIQKKSDILNQKKKKKLQFLKQQIDVVSIITLQLGDDFPFGYLHSILEFY